MPNNTTGIESVPAIEQCDNNDATMVQRIPLRLHMRLTQVTLVDVTDTHNELVHERTYLLHPSERDLSLQGNLFVLEDRVTGTGKVLIKQAPLPHARPVPSPVDVRITGDEGLGFTLDLLTGDPAAETWTVLDYTGGDLERTRVLHQWQQSQRPATPGHQLPRFFSNTWGDRSRDSRMNESFIRAEIEAAHQLGVDVVQLDDGWQQGTTSNSAWAKEHGGVWEGFWNADPNFWQPHLERFPHGLRPLVQQAQALGMNLGLWFAPDSWQSFANWQRDADLILRLHRELGIEHFKIDGVKILDQTAQRNLKAFFDAVLHGSEGKVVFDLDVTASVRPGYFGAMDAGPLFVENRYTDWHNYWPHQTLRNLWHLSRWIDPRRLRMEFLNNARNAQTYSGDPLAPQHYPPVTLFATVMMSNPLGWFEVSNLPDAYLNEVAPLVALWREHRQALFDGVILPIGAPPDGFAWTGFASVGEDAVYVLAFRELSEGASTLLSIPGVDAGALSWQVLAGSGAVASHGSALQVRDVEKLGFVWVMGMR